MGTGAKAARSACPSEAPRLPGGDGEAPAIGIEARQGETRNEARYGVREPGTSGIARARNKWADCLIVCRPTLFGIVGYWSHGVIEGALASLEGTLDLRCHGKDRLRLATQVTERDVSLV